ncbi:CLUMA_CG002205, isoform A [Clunio marinus]|uniref:CLUMA_CG002205, isoform A n=1 Tax=Clunio marinus TaxID=568069 RepID=A0A1J1HQ17_9DIPT|nr:CLUMA_CG002205, isoform A [Clunio marinus]
MLIKYLGALLVLLCASVDSQLQSRVIELRTDHFNPLSTSRFDARYLENSEHYQSGGPIFIYISDSEEVDSQFILSGAMWEIARDVGGHLFALEHRYYGESLPTEDTSVDNLRWLTIHQSLADIAQFVAFVRANYEGAINSRVILWGRGYGGALATWARQKYPNAVDGVWASSARINAITEFPEFMSNTFHTINSIGGPECGDVLHEAFRFIENAVRLRDTEFIEQRLNLCSPINVDLEEDVASLMYKIAEDIGYVFVTNARYPEIDEKCFIIRGVDAPENPAENAFEAFARWYVDDFRNSLGDECLDREESFLENIEWNTNATRTGRRQSLWMLCTQLGGFAVANEGENHPFGWRFDINFFRQRCGQIFNQELFTQSFMEQSIADTNTLYGGLRPAVYRVFFTHGEMDPQRNLGPNEDLNANSPAVVMSLQSFGRDFGSPDETDYVVLQQTKARARELIMQWLVDAAEEIPTEPPSETTTVGGPEPAE